LEKVAGGLVDRQLKIGDPLLESLAKAKAEVRAGHPPGAQGRSGEPFWLNRDYPEFPADTRRAYASTLA
jgi:hypothetical protein